MIIIIIIIIIVIIKWQNVITQDNAGQRSPLLIICGAGLGLFQGPSIFTAALFRRSSLPSLWVGLGKYLKTFR